MPYTVYILHSSILNMFYVGHTGDDIGQRVRRHLSDHKGYTGKAKDWSLVYSDIFEEKLGAGRREREIKGWKSSTKIKALINTAR